MDPFRWLNEVIEKRRLAKLSLEREKIIKEALGLERDFLAKKLLPNEYKAMHAELRARLAGCDLEIGISDISNSMERMLKYGLDELEGKNAEKARSLLKRAEDAEASAVKARNEYEKGWVNPRNFLENLKIAYSEMIDADHELKMIFKKQEISNLKEIAEEMRISSMKMESAKPGKNEKLLSDVLLEANSKHRNFPFRKKNPYLQKSNQQ